MDRHHKESKMFPGARVLARTKSREEWLRVRTRGVGGSDSGAIMGISKYKSDHDIWLSKTGQVEPDASRPIMRLGNHLEDAILGEYYGGDAMEGGKLGTLQSKERPHMLANIDGILEDGTIVEIKTCSEKSRVWSKGIPDYYYSQVQHYLYVTGLTKAMVLQCEVKINRDALCLCIEEAGAKPSAVIKNLCSLFAHPMERDDAWLAEYLPKVDAFWEKVQAKQWDTPTSDDGVVYAF